MESDEYIRISEASRETGVPISTINTAIGTGKLPYRVQLDMKVVRISDVLAYKRSIKRGRPPQAKPTPIPEDT